MPAARSVCRNCSSLARSRYSGPPWRISKIGFFRSPGPTNPPHRKISQSAAPCRTHCSARYLWNPYRLCDAGSGVLSSRVVAGDVQSGYTSHEEM